MHIIYMCKGGSYSNWLAMLWCEDAPRRTFPWPLGQGRQGGLVKGDTRGDQARHEKFDQNHRCWSVIVGIVGLCTAEFVDVYWGLCSLIAVAFWESFGRMSCLNLFCPSMSSLVPMMTESGCNHVLALRSDFFGGIGLLQLSRPIPPQFAALSGCEISLKMSSGLRVVHFFLWSSTPIGMMIPIDFHISFRWVTQPTLRYCTCYIISAIYYKHLVYKPYITPWLPV